MIQRGITLTEEQNRYIESSDRSLSKYVQNKINEDMKVGNCVEI